ncbi:MAG TPA: alpha/beta fold hydrolase [Chloroflexia bacterium]|nr:alpha/beta fold hydrolase [Chloroflexia bacterium]
MTKPMLVLLHGALGAADQFTALVPLLEGQLDVHCLDFAGHGATPLRVPAFSMEHFAENVRDYLRQHGIARAHLFGYSMGGYVACVLARTDPALVTSLATLGTKFYWDPAGAAREIARLDPQKIAAKVPHFAHALAARHSAAGWEAVLGHTADLLHALGQSGGLRPADVAGLETRVRICLGDRDTTTTLAESQAIYQALPHGELEVLPATPHELERVALARLAYSLIEFFTAPSG